MASVLEQIITEKRRELDARRAARPRGELERVCRGRSPALDFEAALRPPPGGVRLVAEIKRASPSRGLFADSFDHVGLARAYAANGAAAVSVLTDEKFFRGHLDHLAQVRQVVGLPILRKDFVVDEYQLWEARAAGADAVLLIVSVLEPALLQTLLRAAKGVGLGALVEVHSPEEVETALAVGASVIGINNRNLKTFETTLDTTLRLLPRIPPGPVVVSESGFRSAADVRMVVAAGAQAVLVGEALMRASDVGAKVRELALLP